ncbi:MAG: hypothetical protein [Bacteriophage sp.]|nr:MAG: hypothetical protein [Bacteriophage sp.]
MKVHRIITTIEVENDDHSMTTVELTKLIFDDINLSSVITNINTTGKASDINKVYDSIDNIRNIINNTTRDIADLINFKLSRYELNNSDDNDDY